jgi:CHAT domain-containing protein
MTIKNSTPNLLFAILLFTTAGFAAEKSQYQATYASVREAIARGEVRAAQAALEQQALEAEQKNNWTTAVWSYSYACYAAGSGGQLQKAIFNATKALEMAEKTSDPEHRPVALFWAGWSYRNIRQFDKAKDFLEKGLELTKQIPRQQSRSSWEANISRELGIIYSQTGDAKKAISYLSHTTKLYSDMLAHYRSLGPAVIRKLPTAIPNTQANLVLSLDFLGWAYQRAGNLDEAKDAFERGITILKESQVKSHAEINLLFRLGSIYLTQKDYPRAQESLQNSLALAERQNYPTFISAASGQLGFLLLQNQKPLEAIPYYRKAIDSIESTRSLLQLEQFRSSYFEDKQTTYSSMIQAHLRAKNPQEAFNYSERARSRAFLDILGSKVQLAHSGTMLEHERALQARIGVLRAMMEGQDDASEQTPQLRKELAEAQKDYDEYLTKIRKENKEQASLMNVEPLTLKDVQERLDPGVTMLEYFVADNTVWLWVVEKDRVRFVSSSIARRDLVLKVTALRDTIYQLGEKERLNTVSQDLYKTLIEPALPHIQGRELVIVPHDVLHYLPFQALLASDGRYLIEKYPIYYLSSASLMQFTQEKRRAMGNRVLALGNPDLGNPAMNLRFAELEAKQIQGLYPQSTILLEKQATEEKAKTLSPQNDIIHFASHAELNEDDPLSSAILLAKSEKEDGRLEVREIFGMDLHANLIVLSACETGLGKLSSGDELVGLTRAFIYAGTPSVVASLWNVEDSSTAQLMASFYKNLKTMSKVEALRQAQLNLIRGNVNSDLLARRGIGGVGKLGETPSSEFPAPMSVSTSHPYFWAPFILVGDGK